MSEPATPAPSPAEARYIEARNALDGNACKVRHVVEDLRALGLDDLASEVITIHRPLLAAGVADVRAAAEAMGVGEPAPGAGDGLPSHTLIERLISATCASRPPRGSP